MRPLVVLMAAVAALAGSPVRPRAGEPAARIYGVTVDDVGRLAAVLSSLRALPRRPTIRVVLDVDPARRSDARGYAAP